MRNNTSALGALIREVLESSAAPEIRIKAPLSEYIGSDKRGYMRFGYLSAYTDEETKRELRRALEEPLAPFINDMARGDFTTRSPKLVITGPIIFPEVERVGAWRVKIQFEGFFYNSTYRAEDTLPAVKDDTEAHLVIFGRDESDPPVAVQPTSQVEVDQPIYLSDRSSESDFKDSASILEDLLDATLWKLSTHVLICIRRAFAQGLMTGIPDPDLEQHPEDDLFDLGEDVFEAFAARGLKSRYIRKNRGNSMNRNQTQLIRALIREALEASGNKITIKLSDAASFENRKLILDQDEIKSQLSQTQQIRELVSACINQDVTKVITIITTFHVLVSELSQFGGVQVLMNITGPLYKPDAQAGPQQALEWAPEPEPWDVALIPGPAADDEPALMLPGQEDPNMIAHWPPPPGWGAEEFHLGHLRPEGDEIMRQLALDAYIRAEDRPAGDHDMSIHAEVQVRGVIKGRPGEENIKLRTYVNRHTFVHVPLINMHNPGLHHHMDAEELTESLVDALADGIQDHAKRGIITGLPEGVLKPVNPHGRGPN